MTIKFFFINAAFFILLLSSVSYSEEPAAISPFGSKPIQLSIGPGGITQNKQPGFTCVLDASLGGGHYSEWGQSENDARTIVHQKCSDKSGLLLCKKDKITCQQDK
jgi:hypothetical protein